MGVACLLLYYMCVYVLPAQLCVKGYTYICLFYMNNWAPPMFYTASDECWGRYGKEAIYSTYTHVHNICILI